MKKMNNQIIERDDIDLSIILPVFNENQTLNDLFSSIIEVLSKLAYSFEIIFVDDGSTDGSYITLKKIAAENKNVRLIRFMRNFGQTAAMSAGISYSSGKTIILMDSDQQNDPNDIPLLVDKINEGYDLVSGWRKDRKDRLSKKIPSYIANRLIAKISGVKLHDLGCSLKAYNSDILKEIKLYGEMHRFILLIAAGMGANICEVEVKHHPRKYGKSKYGLNRTLKVLFDLMTVQFMGTYSTKPLYIYGGFAFICFILSCISGFFVIFMKLLWNTDMTGNPFLLLTVLFILITILLTLMGIQSEIITRIYYQSGKVKSYHIKESENINDSKTK